MACDNMEVQFTLTPSDVRAFRVSHLKKSPMALAIWIVVAIILVFLFNLDQTPLYYFLLDHGLSELASKALLNWLPFLVWLLFIAAIFFVQRRRRKTQRYLVYLPQQWTVAPEGLHIVRDGLKVDIAWRAITRMQSRKKAIYIYLDAMQAYIVPARAFETAQGFAEFNEALKRYFNAAHQMTE